MMLFPIFGYNLTAIPLNLSELEKRLGEPLTECYESVYNIGLISHYFTGIVALVISSVGLIGNILSIGVLTSKYMKGTTTNLYLIGLALSDSLMLLSVILVALRDTRTPVCGKSVWQLWNDAPFIPKLYPICHAFALLFQVCSNWITAAFTVDRYLMICHPFIAKRWCTLRRSKMVIASIFFTSFCYSLPRFYEYEYYSNTQVSGDAVPTHWYRLSHMGVSDSFRLGYHLWAWCIFVIGLPSLIIAILNIFLVKEINHSIKRMRFEQGLKTRRHETDVMLIGVIVIFFVCQIPSSVSHIIWGIWSESSNFTIPWMIVNEVGNFFITVNHSVNIIPYYLFSKRFRTLFVVIYFGWIKRCYNIRRKVTPLSRQILPPSSPNGRPRIPSRANIQPITPVTPIHDSPLPLTPSMEKNDSCPFILVKLEGMNGKFL